MTIDELKLRLGKTSATDEQLLLLLDDAMTHITRVCNRSFTPQELKDYGLHPMIAKYVRYELEAEDLVKSETIGGMTQTFHTKDDLLQSFTSELSRLGLRKLSFKRW